jgi:hypothetical protein
MFVETLRPCANAVTFSVPAIGTARVKRPPSLVAVLVLVEARSSLSTVHVVRNGISAQPLGAAVSANVTGEGSDERLVTVKVLVDGVNVRDVQLPTPVGSGVTPSLVFEMLGPAENPPGVSTT